MKKYCWVLLVLGLMACGGPPAFAGQLNLIWDQDFTNDQPCQTATQNSCLFEFIAYHTGASGRVTDFRPASSSNRGLPGHRAADRLLHHQEPVRPQLLLRCVGGEGCERHTGREQSSVRWGKFDAGQSIERALPNEITMIYAQLDQSSVTAAVSYLTAVKRKVLDAVKAGMTEGMTILAGTVASRLPFRTGELQLKVLESVKVTETQQKITGSISTDVGRKHVGKWLEFGISVPAVANKLMVFVAPSGEVVFTRGHKAFKIPGRPVAIPALKEEKAEIMQIIAERMREAVGS
jgi:hypothetical protein